MTLRVEGFHNWPSAPPEHGFLASRHRHEFHVTAWKRVAHSDRDIEIIHLKRQVRQSLEVSTEFGAKSCEDIAANLVARFDLTRCRVMEDGENGAEVTA